MNAARDFIENRLIPTAEHWNYTAMSRWVEACRDEWDKPSEQGVVDKEAYEMARKADNKEATRWGFVQAYEKAKLDKKVQKAMYAPTPEQIDKLRNMPTKPDLADKESLTVDPVVKKSFTTEELSSLSAKITEFTTVPNGGRGAKITLAKNETVEQLPPLPAKFGYQLNERLYSEAEAKRVINQLIDCIAALYKRGE